VVGKSPFKNALSTILLIFLPMRGTDGLLVQHWREKSLLF
jgi:hypothetical protein